MEHRRIVPEPDHLSRRFGATLTVSDASLRINTGEMVGIIGRSGAGYASATMELYKDIIERRDSARRGGRS